MESLVNVKNELQKAKQELAEQGIILTWDIKVAIADPMYAYIEKQE